MATTDTSILGAVIVATIAATGAVAAAIATAVVNYWLNKEYTNPDASRRSVAGNWRGKTSQTSGPGPLKTPIEVDLVIDLSIKGKKVTGTGRVQGGGAELKVKIKGGFITSDHLYFRYESENANIVNFGYCLLRYNSGGELLAGKMMGYGHMSEALVSGETVLKRIG